MTAPVYPSSLDVSAGQPTGYQQYNRLRADALRFGAAPADAVNAGQFLGSYISGIRLSALGSNRLRIQYDPRFPPTLMIRGHMCQSDHNVDLPGSAFSGDSALWYIFANRAAGSAEFSLSANTSATEGPDQRLIGCCQWNGSSVDATSIQTYQADAPGGHLTMITLLAGINYTTSQAYTGEVCPHQLIDFSKLKPGARSAYLIANLLAGSASAHARLYNLSDSNTIVEVSTSSTVYSSVVKSADILPSLPSGETLTRFEFKTSGNRADCYWAALVFEY